MVYSSSRRQMRRVGYLCPQSWCRAGQPPQILSCCPFAVSQPFLPSPGNHRLAACPYNFAFSRMSGKRDHLHVVSLGAGFFHICNVHPCCVNQCFAPFYCWIVFHGVNVLVCLSCSLDKGHLACFQSLAIMNKAPEHLHAGFVWICILYSSWVNT